MNVLLDLGEDILEHIESVRRAYFLTSRRAAISHILRSHMVTSPCGEIARKMEGVSRAILDQVKGPSEWPVEIQKFFCPTCDPPVGKGAHCVKKHGKLPDEIRPDMDNHRRGAGNERMIRWLCACPVCNPDYSQDAGVIAAYEKSRAEVGLPPLFGATPEPVMAAPVTATVAPCKSDEEIMEEVSIDEGSKHSGTAKEFFAHLGVFTPEKDYKAVVQKIEGILKKLQWDYAANDDGDRVYWRPGTPDPRTRVD